MVGDAVQKMRATSSTARRRFARRGKNGGGSAVLGLRQGLASWPGKIKQDLVATWAAGLGFWPFVDLVSYGFIPAKWIPLFVNSCSFVWTIYLSLQAAKTVD